MPMGSIRVALYWTPAPTDPLAAAGSTWLGRDAETGGAVPQPQPGIAEATAAPRHYGFHATLRPPMRLATGWEEFSQVAATLAKTTAPFELPPLVVDNMEGFLALRTSAPCPALQALADACVRTTDPHRLRPDLAELARRRAHGLTEAEEANLLRWGYPHVMSHWRFHMTLTRRLHSDEAARFRLAAEAHFAAVIARTRLVTELAIFTQRDDRPFLIAERLQLTG